MEGVTKSDRVCLQLQLYESSVIRKEIRKKIVGTISLWATSRTMDVRFLWYLAVKNELEEKTKEQELDLRRRRRREERWVVSVQKESRKRIKIERKNNNKK